MILFDYITFDPKDELQSAWERVPSSEFSKGGSLKGRAICIWKICCHTAALFLKPMFYIMAGLLTSASETTLQSKFAGETRLSLQSLDVKLILTGLVSPIGQIMQIFKAAMGILYPGFYFRDDELSVYFAELAVIAQEVECEQELIDIFKQGPSIIAIAQQTGGSRIYYEALFKRDLAIICEKLKGSDLSRDEKMAVLKMFAPLSSDPKASGIFVCAPGVGRLLEQICGCLDVPKEPEKILPWLVMQFQEEILHQIVMQIETTGKYLQLINDAKFNGNKELNIDAAHFGNILIMILGEKIGLSGEMIDKASQDIMAQISSLPKNEQEELLDLFNELYTEEALETYLMGRINSQLDGRPGLKDFRNYMIQKLAETVSETEIEASKKEIQDKFEISEVLSDDPNFYVKLHYFLYPNADPSDENSLDLNEKGIRAFAASLESNPFAYFAIEPDQESA